MGDSVLTALIRWDRLVDASSILIRKSESNCFPSSEAFEIEIALFVKWKDSSAEDS